MRLRQRAVDRAPSLSIAADLVSGAVRLARGNEGLFAKGGLPLHVVFDSDARASVPLTQCLRLRVHAAELASSCESVWETCYLGYAGTLPSPAASGDKTAFSCLELNLDVNARGGIADAHAAIIAARRLRESVKVSTRAERYM